MDVKILDCTLRDGGYVNDWEFGKLNIESIISKLSNSNVEIVECGFLSNKKSWSVEQSKFNSIAEIEKYIINPNKETMYVGMINFGEFDIDEIPEYKKGLISGIRVVFHRYEVEKAIEFSKKIIEKGYKVFIQPMVTINYSDKELLDLVEKSNSIKPYAFYIVDSFGVMKQNDLTRMFYLLDNNLDKDIFIGYHAHNNLQLAYSNAQSLTNIHTLRKIIIDASIFGMGRGAGNLNTELFTNYLNINLGKKYVIDPLLEIIDDILNNIYQEHYWGYSLAHYLSATFNCHPNYASYLDDKNVLTISAISDILRAIPIYKKTNFDKSYIESLYSDYQKNNINDILDIELLRKRFKNKEILIIAPGKSIDEYHDKIKEYCNNKDIIVIGLNFIPKDIKTDYIFISNLKRYHYFEELKQIGNLEDKLILTSNIKTNQVGKLVVNYNDLLNQFCKVEDNSGLLLIKLLIKCGVKEISFAGFDGYSYEYYSNYATKELNLSMKQKNIKELNRSMKLALEYFNKDINMKFITPSKYNNYIYEV